MALEEHNANHSHQERSTAELSFDELAKDVASGTLSRGKALRLLGAALVGGALASIPGVAWADKGGNRECVKCCKEKYPPGPERGQCIRAGARGECPVTCDGMCIPDGEACSADSDCCSSICFGDGFCLPANAVAICCRCQGGCTPTTCREHDCSDATTLNQVCTEICGFCGEGFVTGSYTCTPKTCACGSVP